MGSNNKSITLLLLLTIISFIPIQFAQSAVLKDTLYSYLATKPTIDGDLATAEWSTALETNITLYYVGDTTQTMNISMKSTYDLASETITFGITAPDSDLSSDFLIIIFKTNKVPSTWYSITLQGNATGSIEIYLGEEVGGQGVSGPIIKAESPSFPYTLDASDTNIDKYGIYGCNFYSASTITLQAYNADKKFLSCNVIASAEMLPGTGLVTSCNFISSAGRAIRLGSTSHHTTACNFINCNTAVHHDYAGGSGDPYTYDAMIFYGGTYHVENSTSGDVYVDRSNGSNPDSGKLYNSGGGTITINPLSVTLRVTVKDKDNNGINNAQTAIYKSSDDTELMNEDTANVGGEDGIAEALFQYSADTPIYWRVRKSSTGTTRYISAGGASTIKDSGVDISVTLYEEPLS